MTTLDDFITVNRSEILRRCRTQASKTSGPFPADAATEDGVSFFLDQLEQALRQGLRPHEGLSQRATRPGHVGLSERLTSSQVVHAYGDVCRAISELAEESHTTISASDFRMLTRHMDDALVGAVAEYERERDLAHLEVAVLRDSKRLGFLVHEMRNLLNTAMVAFDYLRSGNVGVASSTGTVLERSLAGLRSLAGRSIAEVRLAQGVQRLEPIMVAAFIEEVGAAATLEARAKALELTVLPVENGVAIDGDRQVLEAVVGNLLQNAFKFTKPGTAVTLRVHATPAAVRGRRIPEFATRQVAASIPAPFVEAKTCP
ncbi:MAG: sensor histidine kinase [Acidobacteria bacterium]|nr:sensor histidine kinase [Acidobacteriota bacterium]